MLEWFNEFLNDDKLMKNVRTIIIFVLPFVLAIMYWGYISSLKFENINFKTIGALTIIYIISLHSARIDIKKRAKDDEIENDTELKDIEEQISNANFEVKHDHFGLEFVDNLNRQIQDKANNIKTQIEINKIQRKMRKLIAHDKRTKALALQKQVDLLKENPVIDKNVKLFKYSDLITNGNDKFSKYSLDAKELNYDPSTEGNRRSLIFTTIKGVISGGIGMGVSWSAGWQTVVGFFGIVIFSFAVLLVIQYPLTRYKTKERYKPNRKRKLDMINDMKEYINARAQEETKEINNASVLVKHLKTENTKNEIAMG